MGEQDGVRLGKVRCVAHSPEAICVMPEDSESRENLGEAGAWIPQSQVFNTSEVWRCPHRGQLVVSQWWAEKQGWA